MAAGNETGSAISSGEEINFSEMRDSVSVINGHFFIFASVLFFHFVNWWIKSSGPPKSLTVDEWKWRNLLVSWVHAVFASVWVITCTLLFPELYLDLFQHINYWTYYCVCFSTGYFFYDFVDMIANNKIFSMWEVTLHHIAVAGMFYYNILIRAQISFSIVALSVEINSVFLHWRKLLQMVQTPFDSSMYLLIKYLNLVTFLIFRGGAMLTITIGCLFWQHKVTTLYLTGIGSTAFFLDILNVILFWRLLKNDILRNRQKVTKKSESVPHKQVLDSQNNCTNNHMIKDQNGSQAVKARKVNH